MRLDTNPYTDRTVQLKDITFQRVIFIHCPGCNENIVERSDERDINTMEKAREYARDHIRYEHS